MKYFKINTSKVILENFEDEIVLINMDSGNYYSIEKVGAEIWKHIEGCAALNEIVEGVRQKYKGNYGNMESEIRKFVDELQQEGLIVAEQKDETREARDAVIEGKSDGEKAAFEAPVLNRYTDMQDLLLLDPIHEVDETGWPIQKPDLSNENE